MANYIVRGAAAWTWLSVCALSADIPAQGDGGPGTAVKRRLLFQGFV